MKAVPDATPGGFGRRRRVLAGVSALLALVCLGACGASAALASKIDKEDWLVFSHCPLEQASECLYGTTSSGEFTIGNKTVPITNTILIQGGLATVSLEAQPLIPAVEAESVSKTPQPVPGGLVGIPGLEIGGEVTATAELAAPASSVVVNRTNFAFGKPDAVTLPIKVKLSNPVLGEECYVGSDSEPIVLELTTGSTSPPPPNEPIHGGWVFEAKDKDNIQEYKEVTLVDNSFSAPAATGCGGSLSGIVDPVLDLDIGLPAAAGHNTAVMKGILEQTPSETARKYLPKKKGKK